MSRRTPKNAEPLVVSPEDADLTEVFVFRRSYNKDGSIRYVQVVGYPIDLDAALVGPVAPRSGAREGEQQTQMSLSRLIAQRMLGRALEPSEVVTWRNGKRGDNRRANLEVILRSEVQGAHRITRSASGVKYVYPTETGRYAANYGNAYLGTYDTVEQAAGAVDEFIDLTGQGVPRRQAIRKVKERMPPPTRRPDNLLIQS